MKKKEKMQVEKLMVAGAIAVALGVMGTSYAKWSKEHSVNAKLSTDKFDFKLSDKGYAAKIVDLNGKSMDVMNVSVNAIDERKNAEISFDSGIPKELLEKGNYLQITFPVQHSDPKDRMALYEYDVDFSKNEDLVFRANAGYLSFGGAVYEYANLPKEFIQDMTFHVYRAMEKKDEQYYGSVYLELSDASRELIATFPTELILDEKVEELVLSDKKSEDDGVMVDYETKISFHLEQANKESGK